MFPPSCEAALCARIARSINFCGGVLHNSGVELIDCPSEMVARWPFLQTEDVSLALVSPEDVALDPVALCQELARQAQAAGAQIFENCAVEEVLLGDERQVYAVNTGNGVVETPIFVDASGIWTGTTLVKTLPYRHVRTAAYPCTYILDKIEELNGTYEIAAPTVWK
ncbi:hypothetical protein OSTOST_07437 [Ostertagia ostertagi]